MNTESINVGQNEETEIEARNERPTIILEQPPTTTKELMEMLYRKVPDFERLLIEQPKLGT
ncbi:MAG: hypothetical protein PHV42_00380 [Candidatus Pacebacteria bacterium]|nr:hypothetical protein [Candidatus Paceibacterota bacterium]